MKRERPKAPIRGYSLPVWENGSNKLFSHAYRATAIAYMKREMINAVENHNGFIYTLEELEEASIGRKEYDEKHRARELFL
jgi:hypothetical protein